MFYPLRFNPFLTNLSDKTSTKARTLELATYSQYFIRKGPAIKTIPIIIIRNILEKKYGKAQRKTPQTNATPFCCLLPYTMYAIPIEPNSTLKIKDIELNIFFFL